MDTASRWLIRDPAAAGGGRPAAAWVTRPLLDPTGRYQCGPGVVPNRPRACLLARLPGRSFESSPSRSWHNRADAGSCEASGWAPATRSAPESAPSRVGPAMRLALMGQRGHLLCEGMVAGSCVPRPQTPTPAGSTWRVGDHARSASRLAAGGSERAQRAQSREPAPARDGYRSRHFGQPFRRSLRPGGRYGPGDGARMVVGPFSQELARRASQCRTGHRRGDVACPQGGGPVVGPVVGAVVGAVVGGVVGGVVRVGVG